jgi:hypothetical protein
MTDAQATRLLALRRAVLGYLNERKGLAFKASHIRESINFDGTDYTQPEVEDALTTLEKLTYVQRKPDPLSPGLIRHEITGPGILFFEGS